MNLVRHRGLDQPAFPAPPPRQEEVDRWQRQELESLLDALMATGFNPLEAVHQSVGVFGEDALVEAMDIVVMHCRDLDGKGTMRLLDRIALQDPTAANALLDKCFARNAMAAWESVPMNGLHRGLQIYRREWFVGLAGATDIQGNFFANYCAHLTRLPDGLKVRGDLLLKFCTSLERLPDGLEVEGMLSLQGCTSVRSLPEGMKVGKTLDLCDCANLIALPDVMQVGQSLNMTRCCRWDGRVPGGVDVAGMILTDGCPSGLSIEEWRKTMCPGTR